MPKKQPSRDGRKRSHRGARRLASANTAGFQLEAMRACTARVSAPWGDATAQARFWGVNEGE